MAAEPPPPGLQAERTELAWVRTALSGAGLAILATRVGPDPSSVQVAVVTGTLVTALGLLACLLRTRSLSVRFRRGQATASPVAVGLLAASMILAELVTLVLVVR